jgi:hypothetical protein
VVELQARIDHLDGLHPPEGAPGAHRRPPAIPVFIDPPPLLAGDSPFYHDSIPAMGRRFQLG